MLHGPLAAVDQDTLLILVAPAGSSTARAADLVRAAREIGTTPVVLAGEENAGAFEGAHRLVLPDVPEVLSPIPCVVPLQLFSYFLAVGKDVNPDLLHRDDERYRRARAQYE
jgi:glucosamine--fructose-6-phosphate aminotransferase (isomerizing)